MNQFGLPPAAIGPTDGQSFPAPQNSGAFPFLVHKGRNQMNIPNGLVVSADDKIRVTLGETLLLCGIAPAFATSLAESREYVAAGDLSIVICQDLLPDGKYSEILRLNQQTDNSVPVIVVSRTGDWEDYFTAVELGAHDFLPYPMIRDELQRIIRNYFAEHRRPQRVESASFL
jgi:DNA-binding NtrC family response regulator